MCHASGVLGAGQSSHIGGGENALKAYESVEGRRLTDNEHTWTIFDQVPDHSEQVLSNATRIVCTWTETMQVAFLRRAAPQVRQHFWDGIALNTKVIFSRRQLSAVESEEWHGLVKGASSVASGLGLLGFLQDWDM